jgi:Ni,Fe-hydrogenase I cytochrome b subunit
MNNLLQLIWGNNGNGRIGTWILRIALVIVILVAAQAIIGVVAMFVSSCVQGLSNFVSDSINSISYGFTGGDKVETLTRLCLWLLTIIIILKIFFGRNNP